MDWIMGLLTGVGITTGIYALKKCDRKLATIQLIITVINPIITALFLLQKEYFEYNESEFGFIIDSAFSKGKIDAWIVLILLVAQLVLLFLNSFRIIDNLETESNN